MKLKMLSECPNASSVRNAPETLNGSAINTVTGWMKLLNCDASTMYDTMMPSSSTTTGS